VKSNKFIVFALITSLGVPFTSQGADEAHPLTLDIAIKNALVQNPELNAERAKVEVSQGLKTSGAALPPPLIFVGAMGTSPLTRSGQMENSIGISQTIPFPTKLISESKEKKFMAEAAEAKLQARVLELTASVKSLFYEFYGAQKKTELLKQKKSVFEEHNQRLRTSALADRIVQGHRVWVQTEISLVENELIEARESEKISQGKLNVVMGNSPDQNLPQVEAPPVTELPSEQSLSASHPELQSFEFSQHAAEAALTGAKSLWLPDLSIQYRNARRFDGLMPNYSEISVGITLPFLYFWQPSGQAHAANARLQEASFELEKVRQDLKMDLLEARARAESLKAQLSNYDSKIVPQAEKRMKIAHGLVPSDMASLTEHRDAMESVVNLQLSELSTRVNYEKAVAKLESLLSNKSKTKETL
jgi:outer membrane protein TolC